jgi:hypothetical protein
MGCSLFTAAGLFFTAVCAPAATKEITFSQSATSVEAYDFVEVAIAVDAPDAPNPFTDVLVRGSFGKTGSSERLTNDGFCDSSDGSPSAFVGHESSSFLSLRLLLQILFVFYSRHRIPARFATGPSFFQITLQERARSFRNPGAYTGIVVFNIEHHIQSNHVHLADGTGITSREQLIDFVHIRSPHSLEKHGMAKTRNVEVFHQEVDNRGVSLPGE